MSDTLEATTEVSNASAPILDVVQDTSTYVVTKEVVPEGGDASKAKLGFSILKSDSVVDKDIKAGKLEVLRTIVVAVPVPSTLAGIAKIVTDEDEAVAIFNRGASSKVTAKLRSYFMEQDEAGNFVNSAEDTFDASEFLSEPTKRRSMTEVQKATKVLKGLSATDLQAAFAAAMKEAGIDMSALQS